jgi:uncharacterized protein
MKRLITAALLACALPLPAFAQSTPAAPAAPASPAKKELVAKLLQLQQPGIDNMARMIAERPVQVLMQQAGQAMQQQVPAEKREATAKSLQADAQKFVEEAMPVVRERAMKHVPSTVGALLEERFSEDELKQLIAWHESPIKKKYEQVGPEMQNSLVQKVLAEAGPVLDPKLQALQQKMGATLRSAAGAPAAGGKPAASGARPPARPASK